MITRWAVAVIRAGVAAAVACVPGQAAAQLSAANAKGVTMGHVHINTADVGTQARFWSTLGGDVIRRKRLTLVRFPGVYIVFRQQDPTGGSVGSTVNHVGLYVRDFEPSVARWKAEGVPWAPVTTNPAVGQGFITGPDKVRVEIYEDKAIATPMQMHHVHLLVPDPTAAQRWYVEHFGAVASQRLGGVRAVRTPFATANVPGAEFTLSKAAELQAPSRGRSIDHVGFEVTNIDRFVAGLVAAGVKTDGPVRDSPDMPGVRTVSITDPWGVDIEITQGLAKLAQAR